MGQFHRFWQPLAWPVLGRRGGVHRGIGARAVGVAAGRGAGTRAARGAKRQNWVWHTPTSVLVVAALVAVPVAVFVRPARRPPALAFSAGAAVLVAAVLAPWIWHWGPVVRDSAEAGPYRSPPAFETVRISPGAVSVFKRVHGPPPVVMGDPQRLFELYAFADVRAAVLPEARTRALPRLNESQLNHLGEEFFSLETTAARRNAILLRLHVSYVLLDLRDQPPDVLRRIIADPALRVIYRDPADVPDHLGRFEILRVNSGHRRALGSRQPCRAAARRRRFRRRWWWRPPPPTRGERRCPHAPPMQPRRRRRRAVPAACRRRRTAARRSGARPGTGAAC